MESWSGAPPRPFTAAAGSSTGGRVPAPIAPHNRWAEIGLERIRTACFERASARIAAVGTAIGLAISFAAGRALRSLLFSTSPTDPWIQLAASGLLLTTALAACYIPARRATRIDPVKTLAAP